MTYRSLEAVHQQRVDELRAEIEVLTREGDELEARVTVREREVAELTTKLTREGPGGGAKGASILRIPFIVGSLLVIGFFLIPLEVYISGYVKKEPETTIVPLVLLLGPALIATVVAWPYRRLSATYVRGLSAGVLLIAIDLGLIVLGAAGVLR